RHYRRESVQVAVAVEGEPVQCGRARDPDADGGDLAGGGACPADVRARHPDPGAALDSSGIQAQTRTHLDHRFLKAPNEIHHIKWLGEADDRIPDQLAWPVPGDLAAAVGV